MSAPLKSRPILLDMTASCDAVDLPPSPTHIVGGMTSLDYGVCDVMPTDSDWRRTPAAGRRPSHDDARSSAVTIDCCRDPAASVGRVNWTTHDDDVEFDSRLCWAAYHHHCTPADVPVRTSLPSPTTSSFRPSPRTTVTASSSAARTHLYDMPQFQS